MENEFFIGLDVGTDSVGYAVTDTEYNLLKHAGEPMWGATVFEGADTKAGRRGFRTSRRRLDRRQQRVALTQEIFAREIAKVDEKFFIRIKESGLYREDTSIDSTYFLFEDEENTDRDYHQKYPTIHHLINDLMEDKTPKDVRLVYLAVAWFMAHRGHFLSEVEKNNISNVLNFDEVYDRFDEYCRENFNEKLWECNKDEFKDVLLKKVSVIRKEAAFNELLNGGKKYKDSDDDPVSRAAIIKLLSGGKIKPETIFINPEYSEIDSVSLTMPEENFSAIVSDLGDDGELLIRLKAIYDWALLAEILDGEKTISNAKVKVYEQHGKDLKGLKQFVRKYIPDEYRHIFRDEDKNENNYSAYTGHNINKKCNKEDFSDFLLKLVKNINVKAEDVDFYNGMLARLEIRNFLPKQVDGDNRVIPYQLYWHELNIVIENAKTYLPFLNEKDESGYTNAEKIMSVFEFKIPYFVGPLRTDNSSNSWMQRKAGAVGKIYPWNFNDMVDLDASEQNFINRMTNKCSYLPGEDVLPKNSLLYSKFMVLNEINNIKVNDEKIPVDVKQQIYEKFKEYKKVSVKKIHEVLKATGCMKDGDVVTGLDETVKSSLTSYHAFKNMLNKKLLTETQVEEIITYITYSEDKIRLKAWLEKRYPDMSDADRKYILNLKLKDFGRLSKKFLTGLEGIDKASGEMTTIIDAMWNTNNNLMQLLSDKFTFAELIEDERNEFYANGNESIDAMLDDMYISNSVKRPIYRTLAILDDIKKATKAAPKRIFIEMARGGSEKGKRTKSRRDQIVELYKNFSRDDVRELSKLLGEKTDNELQSEVLFLYFMQMGRCMYSGDAINIEELKTSKYNVDHIYPQSKVKDDSMSNKVLVLSTLNGEKGDGLVPGEVRRKMAPMWKMLKDKKMISEEKYRRLMRNVPFTDEELQSFINRQLVETRQATKALATILQRMYPDTEIVYVKAGLVSDFRKEFDMLKSRQVNDLHHGKDAYLNIVCGNVYHCRFTKNFYLTQKYSLKTRTLFTHNVHEDENLVWAGEESIAKVRRIMARNNLHYTRFTFERKGGLFDQQPVKAGGGAIPIKKELPIDKYGGYNKATATFFVLVKYREGKKTDIIFLPVELNAVNGVMKNETSLFAYAQRSIARILNKEASIVEILDLPLGMRPIKINTIISLNGFKAAIVEKRTKGRQLGLTSMEPLILGWNNEKYVKKLERYVDKQANRIIQNIDVEYDKITLEENLRLYDLLAQKIRTNKFSAVFGANSEYIDSSRDKFSGMSLEKQVDVLMNILGIFKTGRSGGCDLREIGGKESSASFIVSSKLSNMMKYRDVRLIDESASGIFKKETGNLLELL